MMKLEMEQPQPPYSLELSLKKDVKALLQE
jgi:hypothetical protein